MTDAGQDTTGPSAAIPTGAGTTTRALAQAGLIVTVAIVASRILGYLRYVVIGAAIHDVSQLDAFFAAFRIPDLLFQLVAAGALSTALVPVVAGLVATGQQHRAWRVASTINTLMLGVLAVLALVVFVFADVLVPPITEGLPPSAMAKTIELTRIMVLSPLFLGAGAVATSVLQGNGRFVAAAVAPLVYNLAIIGAAVSLAPTLGVTGLAIGVVAGALGHVIVQVPALRRQGSWIRLEADLRDDAARNTLRLLAPRAIGLGAVQVVFVVVTAIAAGLGAGAITAFNFAFALLQIPIGVIGVPLGIVLLPSLAREAATGGDEVFRRVLVRALGLLAFVMVPITGMGVVLAGDVVTLLFGHGGTARETLDLTAATLAVFMLGLVGHAMIAVLARAFYAIQDTRTPVAAALVAVGLDIVLAIVLARPFGLPGMAGAMAVGAWVETAVLAVLVVRRDEGLSLAPVGRSLILSTIVTVPGALVGWLVEGALVDALGPAPGFALLLARTVIVSAVGGVVVLAGAAALRIPELPAILSVMTDLVRRRGRA